MSLLSDLSNLFSVRRRDTITSNSSMEASVDGRNRSRRRSLSLKCQSLFLGSSQDWKSANNSNRDSKQIHIAGCSAGPPSTNVTPVRDVLSPVSVVEHQESHQPAEVPETPRGSRLQRRPKTPIRRVGELEGYSEQSIRACSSVLAEEYQAVLDLEPLTTVQSPRSSRSLRKVVGQHDLRRTSLDSESEAPTSPNFSDVETIVGSDRSPPGSTTRKRFKLDSYNSSSSWSTRSTSSYYSTNSEKDFSIPEKGDHVMPMKVLDHNQDATTKSVDAGQNIEMKICLDLLKQDLSSALSHSDLSDSTLAAQLWLMIESYESVKRRLHQHVPSQSMPGGKATSESTFQVLDHWLEALYSLYNSLFPNIRHPATQGQLAAVKISAAHRGNGALKKDDGTACEVKRAGYRTERGSGVLCA